MDLNEAAAALGATRWDGESDRELRDRLCMRHSTVFTRSAVEAFALVRAGKGYGVDVVEAGGGEVVVYLRPSWWVRFMNWVDEDLRHGLCEIIQVELQECMPVNCMVSVRWGRGR